MQEVHRYIERKRAIQLLQKENNLFLTQKCGLPRQKAIQRIIALFNGKKIEFVKNFSYERDLGELPGGSALWQIKRNKGNFESQMREIVKWTKNSLKNGSLYMFYHQKKRHLILIHDEKRVKILASWTTGIKWGGSCIWFKDDESGYQAIIFNHLLHCNHETHSNECPASIESQVKTTGIEWSEFCKQTGERLSLIRVLQKYMQKKLYDPPNGIRYREALAHWEESLHR
jgi:hypothetical protein